MIRARLCRVCRSRPCVTAGFGNCCRPCIRSYRRWLKSHDGTIDSAITWARERRRSQRRRKAKP